MFIVCLFDPTKMKQFSQLSKKKGRFFSSFFSLTHHSLFVLQFYDLVYGIEYRYTQQDYFQYHFNLRKRQHNDTAVEECHLIRNKLFDVHYHKYKNQSITPYFISSFIMNCWWIFSLILYPIISNTFFPSLTSQSFR